ncbi:hypothetical protein [Nocardia sp. NPDC004260]
MEFRQVEHFLAVARRKLHRRSPGRARRAVGAQRLDHPDSLSTPVDVVEQQAKQFTGSGSLET